MPESNQTSGKPTVEQQTLHVHMTYMQFSKKVAIASIVSWVVTILAVTAYLVFFEVDSLTADLVKTVAGYSATLTGTVIVAYMGNSSVEKYARYKYDFESASHDMGSANAFPAHIYHTYSNNDPHGKG